MKIAVDAMGGDHAPAAVVEGSVRASQDLRVPVILVGDRERVSAELERLGVASSDPNITIRHATEVVGMDESPVQSIRRKKDSSLRVCFDLVRNKEADAVVSAGNSGAAMAAGTLMLKKLKGVERPAIAVSVPTMKGPAVLLDVGGNVDCKPVHLMQFAIMGAVYARYVLKKENPKIGLLSNGEEEAKGNELTREAHALIKRTSLDYAGYVEGKDIYRGDIDVVVTDGFVGNVVLKLSEGLVEAVTSMLKDELMASMASRLGYMLAKDAFGRFKKKVDYAEYGGAPLLGIDGDCFIGHGRSGARAIRNALCRAFEYAKGEVNAHISEEIEKNAGLVKAARAGVTAAGV